MTQMTEKQIEQLRKHGNKNDLFTITGHEDFDEFCDLALRGLRTMPRPIAEAPKDIGECLIFGGSYDCEELPCEGYGLKMTGYAIAEQQKRENTQSSYTVWENTQNSNYTYEPTHFIPLKALEQNDEYRINAMVIFRRAAQLIAEEK